MKIKMLDTVEDSHPFVGQDSSGNPEVIYDIRTFKKGLSYDLTGDVHDWDRRARKLIGLGKAVSSDS